VKPFSNKLLNVAVAAVFATTVITAASSPVLARQAHRPAAALKTLHWYAMGPLGGAQWVSTLDPSQITDTASADVSYMIYGNLVGQLPNGTVIPELAQGWTISKNHKAYTFTLRKNLHFSNGDKLTAADVAWSITRALKKSTGSPVASLYDGHIVGAAAVAAGKTNTLKGIHVRSATRLTITVDKPIVYFLQTLTYPTADVLDPRIVSGKAPQTFLTNSCVGNVGDGPFKLVCRNNSTDPNHSGFFKSGSTPSITLVPNSRYWGPKPHIKIVQPVYADTQAGYKAFKAGQLDAAAIPSANVAGERHTKGFVEFASSIVDYMTPNSHNDSQMHNIHCRLAVS
jgi:ABC-type oligopeptide transport system substrate-binding subunit